MFIRRKSAIALMSSRRTLIGSGWGFFHNSLEMKPQKWSKTRYGSPAKLHGVDPMAAGDLKELQFTSFWLRK